MCLQEAHLHSKHTIFDSCMVFRKGRYGGGASTDVAAVIAPKCLSYFITKFAPYFRLLSLVQYHLLGYFFKLPVIPPGLQLSSSDFDTLSGQLLEHLIFVGYFNAKKYWGTSRTDARGNLVEILKLLWCMPV